MATNTFYTTIDASYADSPLRTLNPISTYLNLDGSGSTPQRAYIWFPLPVTLGSTVPSASLFVALYAAWSGGPHVITAKRITTSWSIPAKGETGFGSAFVVPSTTSTNQATVSVTNGNAFDVQEFNITSMMQDVANGGAWYGVELSLSTTGVKQIHASESTAGALFRPHLTVEEALAVSAPKNLVPSASRGVSLVKPILSWEYVSNGTTQGQSRVQLNTTSDFSSPLYDSNWNANTLSAWDLSIAGGAPSLTDNTQYYWRVAVRNVNGVESPWSETATFFRYSKGSLSITFPAADNDDVSAATPTFTHTFSGRTQQTIQHFIYHRSTSTNPWDLIYADDPTVTTVTSWTLPEPPSDLGGDFRYALRVWDTMNRVATANDPTYVEGNRIYQYAPAAGFAPVTSLAGSASGPQITLTWSRSPAPTYYHLLVDGQLKRGLIPASDLSTGGSNYALTYWNSGTHDYSIVAVDSNLNSSTSNPSVNVAVGTVQGIWLIAEDIGTACVILGQDAINTSIGEDVAVFYPKGRRAPVLISSVVRGLEGSVSGVLESYNGITAASWLANFRTIKGLGRTANIRLLYGHKSFPIVMGQASESEWPVGETYVVTFDFFQVDEFSINSGG